MQIFKVKWENITLILFGLFFMYCIASHISNNGFDFVALELEVITYSLVLAINYVAIKSTRLLMLKK